ncbi:MAG: hypothetical protein J5542_08670, partial [Bacteroidales bacterium]|nr:hypothetical protein [Bacteroidales bacterium]
SWTFFRLKLSLKLLLCLSSTVNFSIVDLFYFTVLVNKNGQPISGIDIGQTTQKGKGNIFWIF